MEKSPSITNIAKALIAFHKEVPAIKKSADNPFFRKKYADLTSIIEVIEPVLSKNDLTFVQFPTDEFYLVTILMHSSGEFLQSSYKMTPDKPDPQRLGSAITYQRRYALSAILGLKIEDEDDDGNAASGKATSPVPARTSKPAAPKTLPPLDDQTPYEKAKSYLDGLVAKKKTLLPTEAKKFRAQLDESDLYSVGEKTQLNSMIEALTPKTK
jgi:hypothetical protein